MPPEAESPIALDLNILPEQYRPRTLSPTFVLLWGVAIVLAVLLIPSFIFDRYSHGQVIELSTRVADAQVTLAGMRTPLPEVISLTQELSQTTRNLQIAQAIRPTALAGRKDWDSVFGALLAYDPQRIRLTQLYQDRDSLTLTGLALKQEDVLAYADTLEKSGAFQQVLVQSMRAVTQTLGTPQAGATATPTGALTLMPSPTPTLPPYDNYEIDDFEPRVIALGEVQWHNFNPIYDEDSVTFLGKAGRRYCIAAIPQAIGTDTVLEVTLGGVTLTNDDCQTDSATLMSCQCPTTTVTQTLSSLVEVQLPTAYDQEVRIKISNRGQFGPNQWYTLIVSEVGGDLWEPDDSAPKSIAVGEAQARSFYPYGDIDRVSFAVKAGHSYELRTTNLAVGIDTVLSVYVDSTTYQNDDVQSGDLSSRVEFLAISDGTANVSVSNKGSYGTEMLYTLQLVEVGGDAYEPDDYTPKPISAFDQQRHTFYPQGDIDRVELSVKAGRTYEIRTYNLAVGVDTVVSVLVAGAVYQNDDIVAGDTSSRVVFTAIADGKAGITVSNRDQYGPNNEYWLTVSELSGTPTPDLTLTPTGPTPTPGCGDVYEPDDIIPRTMQVGQALPHSFCPSGDIDRAVFTAKAGYAYQIETTNLAIGVDTQISVQIGSTTLTNDDRAAQDLSSVIRLQNTTGADAPVFISVINKGSYGSGMNYTLKVSDIGSGDSYEPDDQAPVDIALGTPQERTFYPPSDVDRVTFVAKSNHRYRIYTSDLAPLVDTVLVAEMGGTQIEDDDRLPGNLSSYLELQNTGSEDTTVVVSVTNKGSYGPDKSYVLHVDDLGAEGADGYEPDLDVKRYISVGEVQRHTFHPALDVDQVYLTVKAGRRYVIYTCGNPYQPSTGGTPSAPVPTTTPVSETLDICMPLIPGVDTVVIVAGSTTNCSPGSCQSDDAYPGTGMLNSRVEFEAVTDGEVRITVYNKGLFGPGMFYYLICQEIGASTTTLNVAPVTTSAAPLALAVPSTTPQSEDLIRRVGLAAPPAQTSVPTGTVLATDDQVIEFVLLLRLKSETP